MSVSADYERKLYVVLKTTCNRYLYYVMWLCILYNVVVNIVQCSFKLYTM